MKGLSTNILAAGLAAALMNQPSFAGANEPVLDPTTMNFLKGLEGAAPIENELDRLDMLYGFGVRSIGVTYNEANQLGSGLRETTDGGLTVFGRKAVERMNKLGMLIDCSHCGDQTTLDVIEASAAPIVECRSTETPASQ